MKERRKSHRVPIHHPIFYTGRNSDGRMAEQGVGIALDISPDGMMFESDEPIDAADISIRASVRTGDTATVDGRLVYSMPHAGGKHRSAIEFRADTEQASAFYNKLCTVSG